MALPWADSLVYRLSSCIVSVVTSISPVTSINVPMIASLTFICVFMPGECFLACTWSNCSPSSSCIMQVITLRLQAGGESWRGLAYFASRRLRSLRNVGDWTLFEDMAQNPGLTLSVLLQVTKSEYNWLNKFGSEKADPFCNKYTCCNHKPRSTNWSYSPNSTL